MIEAFLIFMLALRLGDMGISFWLCFIILVIVKFIRFVIWSFTDN